jgi:arsenical pump membrane protein
VVSRFGVLDWITTGLVVVGAGCVLTGALPLADLRTTGDRVLPLLLFLATVIVLAELTAEAQVFDVIAARLAIVARGNYLALFLLTVLFAAVTTAALNLDTAAVLLTPVMLATARRAGIDLMPLAMTTVWLANTASLLLPVSNLTNLLAADRVGLSAGAFAVRMAVPELAAVAATTACLWLFYWRRGQREHDRYEPPEPHAPEDRVLFAVAGVAVAGFLVGVLAGVPLEFASSACAAVLVLAFLVRARGHLKASLIPWQLLFFVVGLFVVVETVSRSGLGELAGRLVGTDDGAVGVLRAAWTGAGLSNAVNNLPAYLVAESAIPEADHDRLLGLLVGTNVAPLITPWASLATLLWAERCLSNGVRIKWSRFIRTGAVTAVVTLTAASLALVLTR